MMNKLMPQCKWPKLSEKYDLALRSAVEFVLETYDPVGIVASGTIIRGTPDQSSDLDIYVIHKELFRQRLQKFFNGIPAEIFINPPVAIEGYFKEEQQARRPLTAHLLATGFVILDHDPAIETLQKKASSLLLEPPPAPKDLIYQKYLIALLYEDAVDVVGKDPDTAHMIVNCAVVEMLNFCFIRWGKFIPRQKSLLNELRKVDVNIAELAHNFYRTAALQEKMEIAGQMADKIVGERGFFEWEAPPNEVTE